LITEEFAGAVTVAVAAAPGADDEHDVTPATTALSATIAIQRLLLPIAFINFLSSGQVWSSPLPQASLRNRPPGTPSAKRTPPPEVALQRRGDIKAL
jgi:hypothetical protein